MRRFRGSEWGTSVLEYGLLIAVIAGLVVVVALAIGGYLRAAN
jgi:Flp pilus assembly pilin Flp